MSNNNFVVPNTIILPFPFQMIVLSSRKIQMLVERVFSHLCILEKPTMNASMSMTQTANFGVQQTLTQMVNMLNHIGVTVIQTVAMLLKKISQPKFLQLPYQVSVFLVHLLTLSLKKIKKYNQALVYNHLFFEWHPPD